MSPGIPEAQFCSKAVEVIYLSFLFAAKERMNLIYLSYENPN